MVLLVHIVRKMVVWTAHRRAPGSHSREGGAKQGQLTIASRGWPTSELREVCFSCELDSAQLLIWFLIWTALTDGEVKSLAAEYIGLCYCGRATPQRLASLKKQEVNKEKREKRSRHRDVHIFPTRPAHQSEGELHHHRASGARSTEQGRKAGEGCMTILRFRACCKLAKATKRWE